MGKVEEFDYCIIDSFSEYNSINFKVQYSNQKIFICGGVVLSDSVDSSFRQRAIISMSDDMPYILAEDFKDYSKLYDDLLIFEDNIAQISSIILIFLESPGSLVEFGIFVAKPEYYKKLFIVVPSEETKNQDSFIYLGPLEHIRKRHINSVHIYPWPERNKKYEQSHMNTLIEDLQRKLEQQNKTEKFKKENFGHLCFLIAEIIRLSYPIILDEIQLALEAMNIDVKDSTISRALYLLRALGYIDIYEYSNYKYYFPKKEYRGRQFTDFGVDKNKRRMDESKFLIKLRETYMNSSNDKAKKRVAAMKQVNKEYQ